jgi:plastocyanin
MSVTALSPRRATVVLAVAVLVTAAACGDDDAASDSPAPSSASTGTEAPSGTTASAGSDAGATTAPSAEGVTVTIKTFDFQPDPLTVKAGTKVTFDNEDKIEHTVTSGTREKPTPDSFNGVLSGQGTTFELTLDKPGTYDYFCSRHKGPGMTATIVVE